MAYKIKQYLDGTEPCPPKIEGQSTSRKVVCFSGIWVGCYRKENSSIKMHATF